MGKIVIYEEKHPDNIFTKLLLYMILLLYVNVSQVFIPVIVRHFDTGCKSVLQLFLFKCNTHINY